ncbi:hypothetical protein DINM_003707 [Dirofilaria immitis]|nr:hypothetical protein [Dirofilaria immitis]
MNVWRGRDISICDSKHPCYPFARHHLRHRSYEERFQFNSVVVIVAGDVHSSYKLFIGSSDKLPGYVHAFAYGYVIVSVSVDIYVGKRDMCGWMILQRICLSAGLLIILVLSTFVLHVYDTCTFRMVQLLFHCSLSSVLLTVSSLSESFAASITAFFPLHAKIIQLLLSEQQRHQQQLYHYLDNSSN